MRIDTKFPPRRGKVTLIRGIGYSTYVVMYRLESEKCCQNSRVVK